MKIILPVLLSLFFSVCSAQKYALIDKKMILPVIYSNTITSKENYNGYFMVEKNKLSDFIKEVEKIGQLLSDSSNKKPEKINISLGSTSIQGVKFSLAKEERMDIKLTTDYGTSKTTMHLCDPNISNATNAYFITTWLKYIHSYVK